MRVLLVDGVNLAVRRFYAMGGKSLLDDKIMDPPFMEDVAWETVRSIESRRDLDEYDELRVALESPVGYDCWRYEVYPDYKRAESEPDKPQVGALCQMYLVDALHEAEIPALISLNMEADDVLATMVARLHPQTFDTPLEIHVWSSDKDLWQTTGIDDRVRILREGSRGDDGNIQVLDAGDVVDEVGVPPDAIPLWKALAGDSSDNLHGIEGIGPKTAAKILRPAPFRTPCPYFADPDLVSEVKGLKMSGTELVGLLLNRYDQIKRDTNLAYLRRSCKLLPAPRGELSAMAHG